MFVLFELSFIFVKIITDLKTLKDNKLCLQS